MQRRATTNVPQGVPTLRHRGYSAGCRVRTPRTTSILALVAFFALGFVAVSAQTDSSSCVVCHTQLGGDYAAVVQRFSNDIHGKNGLSCHNCHGGDPTSDDVDISMNKAKGFLGAPAAQAIPEFCGRCHSNPGFIQRYNPSLPTDQLDKYWTSDHGRQIKAGNTKVAQCVSCHSVHDIRSVKDPLAPVYPLNVPQTCAHCHSNKEIMASAKIPTDQYDKYKSSVHGIALLVKGDLGAPACNSCHGNHAAVPPGFSSIGRVCYQCHLVEGERFTLSPHKPAFDALQVEECVFCHSQHDIQHPTDQELGVGQDALCVECHDKGDKGYEAAALMSREIDSLRVKYETALALLDDAERKGVEVSEALFSLRDVRTGLVNARALIHAFNPDTVTTAVTQAMVLANQVQQEGVQAVAEVKHRRSGYYIFTIITIVLVLVLYAWTRATDRGPIEK